MSIPCVSNGVLQTVPRRFNYAVWRVRSRDDIETPGDRLKQAREQKGFDSAQEFADAFGFHAVTYRAHENGTRNFNLRKAAEYAKKLSVDAYWLVDGKVPVAPKDAKTPVVGYIGAGAEVFAIDDHAKGAGMDEVPAPQDATGHEVAVIVRGDSMYPAYSDGDVLYYDGHEDTMDKALGRECAVKLEDGRILVKMVNRGSALHQYTLTSHNAPPIQDVRIEWAARIRWVRKAG
jgi:hypothetical protein